MLGSGHDGLVALIQALGRSIGERFDPARFLDRFSPELARTVPHERLVIALLDEGGRTFTIFAEYAADGTRLYEGRYTTDFDPAARLVVADWAIRDVFTGQALRLDDIPADPRLPAASPVERHLAAMGFRSGVIVPLRSGDRTIGCLSATSRTPRAYQEAHLEAAVRVAELIGPFIEHMVLFQRERRRRQRLRALSGMASALGASLNVRDVFARLAEAVRPVLDFDVIGVALLSASGREVLPLAEIDDAPPPGVPPTPPTRSLDDFSMGARVAAGETVIIHDAPSELDPSLPADREIIEAGGRASLIVPLESGGEVKGGIYFGKRRPNWYDRSDAEIAQGIASQVMLMVQHQQLAEDQRRIALAEGRARRLEQRIETLRSELHERYGFDRIIGRSPALRAALERAEKVAPTETTVLITGESGTGKELVARAIHAASARADGPFLAINCAAIPETLLESELFGYERGAFTGADRQKAGRFEQAAGGTLFLDEVGELSGPVQAALLRVIQEREFQRVGGSATIRADVRLITATNRDLERAAAEGRFRQDLYYRLNVFPIHLPPLRERGTDVLLLAAHFVRSLGVRMGKGDVGLSEEARAALLAHRWPGNIRELSNAVERALILNDGGLIAAGELGLAAPRAEAAPAAGPAAQPAAGVTSLADVERRLVEDALRRAGGNRSEAARLLGLTRSQLYTRLKRFGLEEC
ncbi:MAG TPA: sigma 54-interacting transcriptional regulator [Thermodesulfobacteriota bacterium]